MREGNPYAMQDRIEREREAAQAEGERYDEWCDEQGIDPASDASREAYAEYVDAMSPY